MSAASAAPVPKLTHPLDPMTSDATPAPCPELVLRTLRTPTLTFAPERFRREGEGCGFFSRQPGSGTRG